MSTNPLNWWEWLVKSIRHNMKSVQRKLFEILVIIRGKTGRLALMILSLGQALLKWVEAHLHKLLIIRLLFEILAILITEEHMRLGLLTSALLITTLTSHGPRM